MTRDSLCRSTGLLALLLVLALTSCSKGANSGEESAGKNGPIPAELGAAESASEDTIDLALAGKRDRVVVTANRLKDLANGPLIKKVRSAGAKEAVISDFKQSAARVAQLAPEADLLSVAIESNHAYGDVTEFFALFASKVPADVSRLDHADFEAKLRATAKQNLPLGDAVHSLAGTWTRLRPGFVKAGGSKVAPKFDAHVKRMERLLDTSDWNAIIHEAQHGLDLVDELEDVYRRS